MHKTHHQGPNRIPIELVGTHLYEVNATTADGQTATAIVAADNEWRARTSFMLVQTAMQLRGQLVAYRIRQLDMEHAS